MDKDHLVFANQIENAKKAGWTVKDLNANSAGMRVRGPNWILYSPNGGVAGHGWDEDEAWSKLHPPNQPEHISAISRIMSERARQDAKWGEQNHDPGKWLLILTEELGEVAKSQLEGDRDNYLKELVQSAAVLVAWLECELRKDHAR